MVMALIERNTYRVVKISPYRKVLATGLTETEARNLASLESLGADTQSFGIEKE